MLIVIDKRIPEIAKIHLAKYGNVIEFETFNITYPAISCHPDIFFSQTEQRVICAPNLPLNYLNILKENLITFYLGDKAVGKNYPESVHYNCTITEKHIFHRKEFTDTKLLEYASGLTFIEVPQAYTRCNLIALSNETFITSDKGIESALRKQNLRVYYFSPEAVLLSEMKNGFIGGALGVYDKKLFVIGNPAFHSWGKQFREVVANEKLELVCLYDGPFIDGGGIFFFEQTKQK